MLYANGFGTTSSPVSSGSTVQSGTLPGFPVIKIAGVTATVIFAGLISPGEFQINVVVPGSLAYLFDDVHMRISDLAQVRAAVWRNIREVWSAPIF